MPFQGVGAGGLCSLSCHRQSWSREDEQSSKKTGVKQSWGGGFLQRCTHRRRAVASRRSPWPWEGSRKGMTRQGGLGEPLPGPGTWVGWQRGGSD